MKKLSFLTMILMITCSAAQAACYADYKAKQDDPLRLHYGVAEVDGDCSVQSAEQQLEGRLASDGWQLLNVLGVFDDAGLEERKESAGEYYLRY
ncbi:hypothetical protein SAMN04488515_3254 [Cognatiyoonia koreensis]|uniref:DUF4177 domain-containing protein n=1 Tax=Cognatiyoonia koreensis TaxID=364200 RepID=A0A1I0RU54_9RHOB|nr:hypothetical protein [Cognatiyoonia koreensis]SEW44868.1 hypothetical protein SAMN04488515_3254 [Cognatiyoonia koreensis]